MNWSLLTQFVDANKIGGWVRAAVASGLALVLTHYAAQFPLLSDILSPQVQLAIGAMASTLAVGLWSQLTKTDKSKVQAAAAVLDPETGKRTIVVTSAALAAATPNQPNIVSHDDVKVTQQ